MQQKTNNNSNAIQIQGDVNIGLSYKDIKTIVEDLYEQNFPQLVKEAGNIAKKNIDEYYKTLESDLKRQINNIDINKFITPNTQYLLNNSITIVGRKGNQINLNMLSEALISGLRKNNNEMLTIVSEQAIEIIPRLTPIQIQLLTLIQYISYMYIENINDFAQTEAVNNLVYKITNNIDEKAENSFTYLTSLGVVVYNQFRSVNPYNSIKTLYNTSFKNKETSDIESIVKEKSPSLFNIAEKFKNLNLGVLELTPVGKLIALINLRRILGNLDYKIWIN